MNPSYWFVTDRHTNVQVLSEDNENILVRRRHDGGSADPTTTLALIPASPHPTPFSLGRLTHYYELKDELDASWAVRPIALEREREQPVLVLEDPGGEPLDRLLGAPMEVGRFLLLAIGIAMALGKAHQRDLVHKDLRPANILVNGESGEVRLTGFGTASRLLRERQSPEPLDSISGNLAYMAPEQTGRMNRSIDSRSDLYSLGVTCYQMLTGRLPFTASDAMEWVHCHIARKAVPPGDQLKNLPVPVSAIVMKLLAKAAEDRYQTAAGVEGDLRHCLAAWDSLGRIDEFALGEHDTPDRLLIPEKLYGRAREIELLLASFDRVVRSGTPELVLVSGYSGVGKSSVVNEVHKVLVPPRGLFASGKFDQYKRDIPYATLAQAFQSLVRPLLGKSQAELQEWRVAFQEALGPNGLLIVDLVPELKLIIGEQPPLPDLPLQDAQSRFQLVFRRFIGVFARPEHPLTLFLDDLQWLDAATLDVLGDLLTTPDVHHLLLIGAYRDNEVHPNHPLIRKLEAVRAAGAIVQEIVLAPLTGEDLQRLVADTLRCEVERSTSLARLVHEKTIGNPFFVIQFMSALAEEGCLTFDHSAMRWSWDLRRVQAKGYTDNVVDLITGKLNRLSAPTQNALQLLACIGNAAEYALLATAYAGLGEDFHHDIWEAVRTGLVLRSEGAYRFLHDRVQEAAYSLIPEEARGPAHLRIGRLLASRTEPAEIEGRVFEIVNQLNRASHLITSADERTRVARLNLIAGRRARVSTAYASAIEYLAAGRALLTEEAWERNCELIFDIEFQTAECELLTANMAAAEPRLSMLAERAARVQDVAAVARLRITLYTTLDRSDRAVEMCLEYLRRGGTDWSAQPTRDQVQREYDRIWSQLGSRPIETLMDLPLMADPLALATLDVLTETVTPAGFINENLLLLVICRMVNLSLEHGNSDGSCFAYVWLGKVAGPRFGSYEAGFRFGHVGYELVEKRSLYRFQARTYLCFGHHVVPWTRHIRAGRDFIRRGSEIANRIGDLTFAAYSCNDLIVNLLASGEPLGDAQREAEKGLDFARRARFGLVIDALTPQLCLIRTLRGLSPTFGSFNNAQFDELRFERHLAEDGRLALPECWYWIRKLQARFFAGNYSSALEASLRAQRLLWAIQSYFERTEYEFYTALSRAALWDSATVDERQHHFEVLTAHHKELEEWAANCPENFEARAALVSAEIARIQSRDLEAIRFYEQAIRCARESGFVHSEGVANEVAGRFYLSRGLETNAYAHLRNAIACFALWGADGKVAQLDRLHPRLREELATVSSIATLGTSLAQLDIGTVVKASQAVSREILLDRLVETLMTIALEHAGADRGMLILLRDDGPQIEAEARTEQQAVEVTLRHVAMTADDLPVSIVHTAIRTRQTVILDDARRANPFGDDEYMRRRRPRSVLCLPLVKQAELIGLLYLENNLAAGTFTPQRTTVLELLASQAAISIENARLYSELISENRDRRKAEEALRASEASLAEGQRISHTGSWRWNVGTGEVRWSAEHFRIFGFDPADVRPSYSTFIERVHPEDRLSLEQTIRQAVGEREPFQLEYRIVLPDGSVKHELSLGRPTVSVSGDLEYSGTVMDITERKQAEEALRNAQAELARVARLTTMGELAASIAHEINQPLGAIVTSATASLRWLERKEPDIERARAAVSQIAGDGMRAGQVIQGLRALARKAGPELASIDLNDAIREILALTHSERQRHGVELRTEFFTSEWPVLGDRVQLQQVMLNLIMNGIEAMTAVTDRPRVLTISSEPTDAGGIAITVEDTGTGVDPANADRIFDPFFTTKPDGMGMGLSICRTIIEAHGGRLWASPRVPHGTVFRLTVPAGAENSPDVQHSS
jgi:PAS domain S-box-containing protein